MTTTTVHKLQLGDSVVFMPTGQTGIVVAETDNSFYIILLDDGDKVTTRRSCTCYCPHSND